MQRTSVFFAALALSSVVCAQTEPVPTRIHTELYGTTAPGAVGIECDIWDLDNEATQIRISGGAPGDLACLFIGAAQSSTPTPWGTLLVPPTAIPAVGIFDVLGNFELPINLARAEWVGADLFFQGACLDIAQARLDLSWGLQVTYHDGNPPLPASYTGTPLTYTEGPPITVTPLRQENPYVETMHQAVFEFAVPTHGWQVYEQDILRVGNELEIYLKLEAPSPDWNVPLVPTTIRLPMDLGADVGDFITIFVWESVAMTSPPEVYNKAAVVDTKY